MQGDEEQKHSGGAAVESPRPALERNGIRAIVSAAVNWRYCVRASLPESRKLARTIDANLEEAQRLIADDDQLFNRREERIVALIAALKRAKETIRQWNGMGLSGEAEKAAWDTYQHSPEMRQINDALESDA